MGSKSANLHFLEEMQISNLQICVFSRKRRFADSQIVFRLPSERIYGMEGAEGGVGSKSANLHFLEEMQISNLRMCIFSRKRRFADSQIFFRLPKRWHGGGGGGVGSKSANLRFLEEMQISNLRMCIFSRKRRFADSQIFFRIPSELICGMEGGGVGSKSAKLRFLEETQIRRLFSGYHLS